MTIGWNDTSELLVAQNGEVYVAPIGTALPTSPTAALDAAFVGLGYIAGDGAKLAIAPQVTDFSAWQSRQPVRREMTAQEVSVTFELLQWNEDTLSFAWGGGSVSGAPGNYRFDLPLAGAALDERSMVLDVQDGTTHHRFVFPRGTVTDTVESKFTRTDLGSLPITFKALEPTTGGTACYFLSDSTAFVAGS